MAWVIDKLRAGWTPPNDLRQVPDRVPRKLANVGELRHNLPVDLPPVTCTTVSCGSTYPVRITNVASSGVDGCEDHVSRSGYLSINARHTSTTGPYVDTEESNSIVGAKTVGEGIHTEVEPISWSAIARKTHAL